ncbi:MAG: hypothetical protein ACSHXL_02055 [Bacteroidota bacterium]
MESVESKLFDLLEAFSFDELEESQQNFVLLHMTKEEFLAQQKVMRNAGLIDFPEAVPQPLSLEKRQASGLLIPIPLYKVLLGAAATFLGLWFFWPSNGQDKSEFLVQTKVVRDTVYLSKVKHDTIRINAEKTILAKNERKPDTVYVYENDNDPLVTQRMLEPGVNQTSLVLNEKNIATKGSSLKNDETMNLLPAVPAFGL